MQPRRLGKQDPAAGNEVTGDPCNHLALVVAVVEGVEQERDVEPTVAQIKIVHVGDLEPSRAVPALGALTSGIDIGGQDPPR